MPSCHTRLVFLALLVASRAPDSIHSASTIRDVLKTDCDNNDRPSPTTATKIAPIQIPTYPAQPMSRLVPIATAQDFCTPQEGDAIVGGSGDNDHNQHDDGDNDNEGGGGCTVMRGPGTVLEKAVRYGECGEEDAGGRH
ncbi:hypothetical protein EDD85DRAFT_796856 [Armillaria nabsnona]|nr:hypothetical protein EDD85DRAFT_796856 [Armillaria nabsnona]